MGCVPVKEEVIVYHESSRLAALVAANLEANQKGGLSYFISNKDGSMRPVILPYDYIVAVPTPFEELKIGMVCNYYASWNLGTDGKPILTCHRIVDTWPNGGFLMEGDGPNNTPEKTSGMYRKNYVDHVISTYRADK